MTRLGTSRVGGYQLGAVESDFRLAGFKLGEERLSTTTSELLVGEFRLGSRQLGQASAGGVSAFKENAIVQPNTSTATATATAGVTTASTGGTPSTASASTGATADGITETLASGSILAASGNTAASGGETVTVSANPGTASPTGTVSAPALRQSATATGVSSDPTTDTTASALKTLIDLTTSEPGGPLTADSTASTTSEVGVTDSNITPSISTGFPESIAGEKTLASTTVGSSTATTETTAGLIQTALASSIAVTPDTQTIGLGRTTTTDTFVTTVDPDTASIGGEVTSAVGVPVISTVTAKATADGIVETLASASILGASADTAAGGGETVVVSSSTDTATATTSVDGVALLQTPGVTPKTVDPLNETTGLGLKTLVKVSSQETRLGDFRLGEEDVSSDLVQNNRIGESSLGDRRLSSFETGPLTATLNPATVSFSTPQSISVTSKDSSVFSESTDGTTTPMSALTLLSGPTTTTTTAGQVQTALGASLGVSPDTQTKTDAVVQTLASGTVLAASADTAVSGGEVITVTGTPTDSTPSTSATAQADITAPVASALLSSPSTSASSIDAITSAVTTVLQSGVTATVTSSVDTQTSSASGFTSDPTTKATASALKTLVDLRRNLLLSDFQLGSGGLANSEGGPIRADSTTSTTSVSTRTSTTGTPLTVDPFLEAISGQTTLTSVSTSLSSPTTATSAGIVQSALSSALTPTADTQTTTDAVVQTMVSGTVLAASGFTAAAGAELLKIDMTPKISTVDTSVLAPALLTSAAGDPKLLEPTTRANSTGFKELATATTKASTPTSTATSAALLQSTLASGVEVNTFTQTTATTVAVTDNRLGSKLGESGFGVDLIQNNRTGERRLGDFGIGPLERADTRISASPLLPDSVSEKTAQAIQAFLQTDALLSDSVSESIDGSITPADVDTFLADSLSEGIAPGDVGVLATTTVKASSAFTEVTGGETLRLALNPITVDPFTETTTDVVIDEGGRRLGEQKLGEFTSGRTNRPLIQRLSLQGRIPDPFTEIVGNVPAFTPLTTNPINEELAESFGGEITGATTSTFEGAGTAEAIAGQIQEIVANVRLADVIAETTGEGIVTLATVEAAQGIRFLSDWAVYPGPKIIETVNEEVRTFRELTLTWILSREDLVDVLRPEIDDAGSLELVDRIDGGFDVVTRGENNDIRLEAPTDHSEVRPIKDWFVQEFEEEPLGTDAERWKAEVVVSPDKEKAYDNEYGTLSSAPSKTRSSGQWLFEFAFGDVATRRVTSDVTKAPDGSVDTAELDLVLEPEEVRVIEESLSKLAATSFVGVPDGSGYIEDNSDGQRNTVTLTVPNAATDTVESGDYVVTEWETTWTRNRAHKVSLVLKQP